MTTMPEISPINRGISRLRVVRWDFWVGVVFVIGVLMSRLYLMMVRPIYFFDESLYIKQTEIIYERGVMSGWATNPGIVFLNIPWYVFFRNIPLGLDYASRPGVGTYRIPTYPEWISNTYHRESATYSIHGFYQHRGERVCIAREDLDAMSLAFYARQIPIESSFDIYSDLVEGTLAETLKNNQCASALIALTGWHDQTLINSETTFNNTNANILYKSDMGSIVLLNFPP